MPEQSPSTPEQPQVNPLADTPEANQYAPNPGVDPSEAAAQPASPVDQPTAVEVAPGVTEEPDPVTGEPVEGRYHDEEV